MSTAVIREPIAQLQRQLDQIRNTQPREKQLPDSVWQAAVELAREHGVYSVAHPLRLDYTGLKKRLGGVSHRRRKARKPAFAELIAPSSAMLRECHATLYTESSDSFLPLRCRLDCYRVERTSSRAGVAPAVVKRLSRHTVTPTMGSSRRDRADGPSSVSMFWVEPYHLAFGRQL